MIATLKKQQDKQLHNPEAPMDNAHGDFAHHFVPDPDPDPGRHNELWGIGTSIVLVFSSLLVVMAIILFACSARAHDYKHPENQQWYESLRSSGDNTPCCDGAEANHIADMDWDTTCEQNNFGETNCHYRVFLHNRWWDVPARAVVDGANRDGSALVWELPTPRDGEVISTFIRCFMPGAGG